MWGIFISGRVALPLIYSVYTVIVFFTLVMYYGKRVNFQEVSFGYDLNQHNCHWFCFKFFLKKCILIFQKSLSDYLPWRPFCVSPSKFTGKSKQNSTSIPPNGPVLLPSILHTRSDRDKISRTCRHICAPPSNQFLSKSVNRWLRNRSNSELRQIRRGVIGAACWARAWTRTRRRGRLSFWLRIVFPHMYDGLKVFWNPSDGFWGINSQLRTT